MGAYGLGQEPVTGCCEHSNEPLHFIRGSVFE
jgi:hypothetical protein